MVGARKVTRLLSDRRRIRRCTGPLVATQDAERHNERAGTVESQMQPPGACAIVTEHTGNAKMHTSHFGRFVAGIVVDAAQAKCTTLIAPATRQ